MALHRLGQKDYLNWQFNRDLWKGVDTTNVAELIPQIFPAVTKITSLSENRLFTFLCGRVGIGGKGKVSVIYPYRESHETAFTLRGVDLTTCPYVILEADKENFKGWFDSITGNCLTDEPLLVLSEYSYSEVTGFIARFEPVYENTVGI